VKKTQNKGYYGV